MEKWVKWATEIDSIAQAGLTYSKDNFDIERFNQLKEIASEIISEYTKIELDKVKKVILDEKGYLTPKVDVRAAIIKDNKILMVKEILEDAWSLPGGWADINLSLSENIIKESYEESGAIINPKKLIAVLDRNKYNEPKLIQSIYKIFVLCELKEIEFKENIETSEYGFFGIDELPNLSISRNTKDQIKICFEAYKNTNFEAIFD
ncbi:NUDIX hydrolase [Clostridium sp. B9]|uniref:NUDIX hydrolase n=1 Tax=Clostridium sp. B9 TaxID=3423224 RepID=UPI003D2E9F6D